MGSLIANHTCFASTRPQCGHVGRAHALSFRSRVGGAAPLCQRLHSSCAVSRAATLTVENAINRATKEKRVAALTAALENSSVVFGLRYNRISVKNFEAFRRSLPDGAQLIVSKNTLLGLAAERVPGWSDLKRDIKLENAWVFANEEAMAGSIKAFLAFESKLLEPIPKAERAGVKLTEITAGCMEGKFLDDAMVRRLEKLPSKKELIATIARLIKQVPTKVAVSIRQVPAKVAYGIKAIADADDDKSKVVGDVLPKPSSA